MDPDAPKIQRADQHVVLLTYQQPHSSLSDAPPPSQTSLAMYDGAAAAHEAALKPAVPIRYDPFDPPPWPTAYPMDAGGIKLDPTGCVGGFGGDNLISVDGVDAPATLSIPAGRTQLLRIVNGTADSPKLLRLLDAQGHVVPFRVVERDGVPVSGDMQHPYAHYIPMRELMLTMMSRAGVLLTAAPDEHFVLSTEPFCDGAGDTLELRHDLLRITVGRSEARHATLHATPIAIADTPAAKLVAWVHAHPNRVHRRAITFTEYEVSRARQDPAARRVLHYRHHEPGLP